MSALWISAEGVPPLHSPLFSSPPSLPSQRPFGVSAFGLIRRMKRRTYGIPGRRGPFVAPSVVWGLRSAGVNTRVRLRRRGGGCAACLGLRPSASAGRLAVERRLLPHRLEQGFLYLSSLFSQVRRQAGKKNLWCLCQVGTENTSSRISCLIRSSRLVLLFVLNCRKMGYVPLPMLRTSVGFSAAFGSSTTGGLFTLVNEASFPHSGCIELIAGI